MDSVANDFMGRPIKVGQTVVYCVRRGAAMWLTKLRVQQIIPGDKPSLGGFNDAGRRVQVHNLQNVVVVEHTD